MSLRRKHTHIYMCVCNIYIYIYRHELYVFKPPTFRNFAPFISPFRGATGQSALGAGPGRGSVAAAKKRSDRARAPPSKTGLNPKSTEPGGTPRG